MHALDFRYRGASQDKQSILLGPSQDKQVESQIVHILCGETVENEFVGQLIKH
jgi:hypothetical protein